MSNFLVTTFLHLLLKCSVEIVLINCTYIFKQETTRYEHAEWISTSIKNPSVIISLVEKSSGFLLYAYVFDFPAC